MTVLQLLTMTSGILPADMGHCGDLPASKDWTPADWYYPYRYPLARFTQGDANILFMWQDDVSGVAWHLNACLERVHT